MLTNKQKLEYALQLKRLHEIMVVKENLYFAQSNSNHNRAVKNLETLQDRIIENRVKNHIDGNVDLINHKPIVDQVMNTALVNQRKGLSKTSNKKIDKLVDKNIKSYQEIMNNRLKLDAKTLDEKIERELQKKKYNNLSDNQLKHQLKEEFKGTTKKRINRIVGDALHTNQCNISFATAQEQGYKYKVWNNGRGKNRVRPWHRAKVISAVELDDKFYIYGSYPAYMMYPGDLDGGAENVANCRCWLSYTNIIPNNLKTKGTIKIKDNVQLTKPNTISTNKNTVSNNKSLRTKVKESIPSKVKTVINKVKGVLRPIKTGINKLKTKVINTLSPSKNNKLSNESYGIPLDSSLSKAEFAVPTGDLSEFGISDKGLEVIQGFQGKRFGSKNEYGFAFDEKTGKILTKEFRGVENDVVILSPKKGHSTVHYHTESGFSSLSHGDISSYLKTPKERVGISISKKETWLIKQERKFTSKEIKKITKDIEQFEKEQLIKLNNEFKKHQHKINKIKDPKERELAQKKLDEYVNNEFLDKHNKELGNKILEYTKNIEGLKVKRVINTPTKRSSIKSLPKLKVDKKTYNLYSKNSVPINSKNKEKINKKEDKKLNLYHSKNKIKLVNFKDNFTFESKENLNRYYPKKWVKVTNNHFPEYLSSDLKDAMIGFEGEFKKFTDGKEWGIVYNINKKEFDDIKKGVSDSVNILEGKDYGDNEIIIMHVHPNGTILSPKDFFIGFYNPNNIKYILVHREDCIFITHFKNRNISHEEFSNFIYESFKIRAKGDPKYYWMEFNSNDIINKYISVDLVVKNG